MKKLFLVILFFFCTGCAGTYQVSVTSENRYSENLKITIPISEILERYDSLEQFVAVVLDPYQNSAEFRTYQIKHQHNSKNFVITVSSNDISQNEMRHSPIVTNFFEELLISSDGEKTVFRTVGEYYYDRIYEETGAGPNIEINMRFQNIVEESNADKVDEKTNTYTWYLTGQDDTKNIYVRYSKQKRYDII